MYVAHANWYADDDFIGPVVISIQSEGQGEDKHRANSRVLIRTKKVNLHTILPSQEVRLISGTSLRPRLPTICFLNCVTKGRTNGFRS